MSMQTAHCGDFVPSTHGFGFSALDLPSPSIRLTLNSGSQLDLDEVTKTLGGGMSFAAADYYRAERQAPSGPAPQGSDDLYAYLVQREIDSLDQSVIAHIIDTMSPSTPVLDVGVSPVMRSRARVLVDDELPRITRDLDRGYLVQLCLIEASTSDARLLGQSNRQVVCYGYDTDLAYYVLHIYDPEFQLDDNVSLGFYARTNTPMGMSYSRPPSVAGFFYVPFAAKTPV